MSDITKDSSQENVDFHCNNCEKTFSHKKYFTIHQKAKDKDPNVCLAPNAIIQSYNCEKCTATFKRKHQLHRHVREVHNKVKRHVKRSKCEICHKEFINLKLHQKTVHENTRPYECEICNHKFKLKSALTKHEKLHETSKDISCSLCDQTFSHINYLKSHMKYRHGQSEKSFKCDLCVTSFFYKSKLTSHILRMHKKLSYKCDICQKEVHTAVALKNHLISYHQTKKRFHCNLCDKFFHFNSSFLRHECLMPGGSDKNAKKPATRKNQPRQCDICDKTFKSQYTLDFHKKKIHIKDKLKNLKCDICNKDFATNYYLKNHILANHNPEGEVFKCNVCEKNFKLERYLLTHNKRFHQGVKEHENCGFCNLSFYSASKLKRHQRDVHGDQGDNKCAICDKGFKTLGALKNHEKIHAHDDKRKDNICPYCQKCYSTDYILQTHVNAVQGRRTSLGSRGLSPGTF